SVEKALDEAGHAETARVLDELEAAARDELIAHGEPAAQLRSIRRAMLRYQGTDTALTVPGGTLAELREAFERAYRQRFAFLLPDRALIVESAVAEVLGASPEDALNAAPGAVGSGGPHAAGTASVSPAAGAAPAPEDS